MMDKQKILRKINQCLMENGIFNFDIAKEITDTIEDELSFGQVNISKGNSILNANQNKYKIGEKNE
jgi:hypothetical protein